jgi:hypothetical protein
LDILGFIFNSIKDLISGGLQENKIKNNYFSGYDRFCQRNKVATAIIYRLLFPLP